MSPNRREFLAGAAALSLAATAPLTSYAEKKKYKACVIGDTNKGGYGHDLHLAWTDRENIEVVGLADPDEAGRAKHAEEAGAKRTYADYREMLAKEKPDLVSIGPRWTIHHEEYLMACAEAGAHGYIEKPISTSLAEADAMVEAVQSRNLKWAIGHQKRMVPTVQFMKKAVFEEGLIGNVLELRGRGKEDHRAGGEDLIVLGTHIFDLMLYLMGKPEWCASDIRVDGKPATQADVHDPSEPLGPILGNQIQATFGFEGGIPGFFGTRKTPDGNGGRWGLDIYGTKGIVTLRLEVDPIIYYAETTSWEPGKQPIEWKVLPGAPKFEPGPKPSVTMNAFVIDDLLAAIEEDRQPAVSLESGRDSYEMIQAVYAAYTHGGRIELPLKNREHPLKTWS